MSLLMPSIEWVDYLEPENLFALASDRIVRRGLAYARAGNVAKFVHGETRIEGLVEGTRAEPYVVSVEYDGDELLPSCSCPFDWEPYCKHAIALLAVAARCADGGVEEDARLRTRRSLERQERSVRCRRAEKEGFRIRKERGDGLFGTFEVRSSADKRYAVEIRSLGERLNRCSCPDYATSMLGTCKHIEAVLAASKKRAPRKFAKAATRTPTVGQVLVEQGEVPRIRLVLPQRPSPRLRALAREYFDQDGYLAADPVDGFERFLVESRRIRNLVVYGDAVDLSQRTDAERRARQREDEVQQAVLAAGTRVPGIRGRLYPYQVEGSAFLAARGRALLGDDMGLGKTIQAIAATRVLWDRAEVRRALVVCPASLKHQWAAEIQRFSGLGAQIIAGSAAVRLAQYRRREPFTIVNYELVMRDSRGLADLAPDLLILDEAQRIKNWRTKTAEAVKDIDTPFAFVLTGTPLQNRLDDLYSVMQVVDRRILGPLWAYNERFVVREEGRNRIAGYKNLGELRRRLAPVVLRREKEEVKLQLPERIDSRLGVELTPVQRELMNEAIARAARLAKLAERRPLTPEEQKRLFMAMQGARMACNAAGLVDKETIGSPKLDEFEQLIAELCLEGGRKVVVFSEWERFCRLAAQRAEKLGIPFVRLHGGVPTAKRGALIDRFRDDPGCKIFFSTDAGGVGLNLQWASTMINLELPWNPAVLDQRIGRLHRHGQRDPVHVLKLVSEESFEAGLEQVLVTKRSLFDAALSSKAQAESVEAPASCLVAVRAALWALQEDEAGEEPVFVDTTEQAQEETAALASSIGGTDGEGVPRGEPGNGKPAAESKTSTEDETAAESEAGPAEKIAGLLGPRLQQVLVLRSGKLLAAVDRVDAVTRAAAEQARVAVAETAVIEGLSCLGDDSPLVGAQVVIQRPESSEGDERRKREHVAVAGRKLEAARKLASAGLAAEAAGQAHATITAALRAMAADGHDVADLPSARLIYEVLVPNGALDLEQAALVSRAEGLARAYGDTTTPMPERLLEAVLTDAERFLCRAEEACGVQ